MLAPSSGLNAIEVASGLPNNRRAGLVMLQEPDGLFESLQLLLPCEQVQDHAQLYHIKPAIQLCLWPIVLQDIGRDEPSLQVCFVPKELVRNVDEPGIELGPRQILTGNAIVRQLPDVLAKTTPDIEKVIAILEASQ